MSFSSTLFGYTDCMSEPALARLHGGGVSGAASRVAGGARFCAVNDAAVELHVELQSQHGFRAGVRRSFTTRAGDRRWWTEGWARQL